MDMNSLQAAAVRDEDWTWSEKKFNWVLGGDDEEDCVLNMSALESCGVQQLTEVRETSDYVGSYNIPLYGRIHLVKHRPGSIHLSIIVLYWLYGNWSSFTFLLFPYQNEELTSPAFMWGKFSVIVEQTFILVYSYRNVYNCYIHTDMHVLFFYTDTCYILLFSVHIFFSLMTIISLFRASTMNPGRLPIRGQKDRPPKPSNISLYLLQLHHQ